MKNSIIYYSVGALLYCPANNKGFPDSIREGRFGEKYSLALCLEDTISDNHVQEAEEIMIESLQNLYRNSLTSTFYMPKIFIRVRHVEQIVRICAALGESLTIISGFIAPKFDLSNVDDYTQTILAIQKTYNRIFYFMPILESATLVDLRTRIPMLYELKDKLSRIEESVLNIRVGGNDLSHSFGLRRHVNESIHNMKPVANILTDIVSVFGMDYIVSGPVWEYYNGSGWQTGLYQELKEDLLSGFIGKTVIHPKQIEVVNAALQVSRSDYEDARSILNWDDTSATMVSGNHNKERMNEYKTNSNWALKTLLRAQYYGITESDTNPFAE